MQRKDCWDKFEIIAKIIASILIPILLGVYGYKINVTLKEKDVEIKYIEIATKILAEQPDKTPAALRSWAVDILKEYSKKVPLTEAAILELNENPLPQFQYITDEKGNIITDEKGNPLIFE